MTSQAHIAELPVHEAISGILGSISLATWIFLLVPQLIENYRSQSADGISLIFLTVWLIGDITNLSGAVWAGLVPTVIALAVYFCFADLVLITQCIYYKSQKDYQLKRKNAEASLQSSTEDPTQPLLKRSLSDGIGLPGSRRRSSTSHRRGSSILHNNEILPSIREDDDGPGQPWTKNMLSVVLVCIAGFVAWLLAWRAGLWSQSTGEVDGDPKQSIIGAEILGYVSAFCYLGARIPQIMKNYREKSCEGLSLLFFMLSLLGNLTYGGGILFHSLERKYILTNLPWLVGSLGTMGEDIVIFLQFHSYSKGQTVWDSSAIA